MGKALTEGRPKFPRALTITVAATAVVYVAVAAIAKPSFALTVFGDSAQLLLAVLVSTAFGYHAWRGQGRIRFFWAMLASGAACWFVSQAIWSYYEVILRVNFND